MRRASSLAMRSTYRWRNRVSTSARPCHLSGSGRSAFDSNANSRTLTDNSPRARLHHDTLGADPVAQIEVVECGVAVVAQVGTGHEQLQLATAVAQRGERELAHPSQQHDPTRHPNRVIRLGTGLDLTPVLDELGRGVRAIEADGIGLDPRVSQLVDLGQAAFPLAKLHFGTGFGSARDWIRA